MSSIKNNNYKVESSLTTLSSNCSHPSNNRLSNRLPTRSPTCVGKPTSGTTDTRSDVLLAAPYLNGQWPRSDNYSPSMFDEGTQTPVLWEQQECRCQCRVSFPIDSTLSAAVQQHRRSRSVEHNEHLSRQSEQTQYICTTSISSSSPCQKVKNGSCTSNNASCRNGRASACALLQHQRLSPNQQQLVFYGSPASSSSAGRASPKSYSGLLWRSASTNKGSMEAIYNNEIDRIMQRMHAIDIDGSNCTPLKYSPRPGSLERPHAPVAELLARMRSIDTQTPELSNQVYNDEGLRSFRLKNTDLVEEEEDLLRTEAGAPPPAAVRPICKRDPPDGAELFDADARGTPAGAPDSSGSHYEFLVLPQSVKLKPSASSAFQLPPPRRQCYSQKDPMCLSTSHQ